MLRLLLVLLRPPPLCPARQRWASPRVAPPLPPRCWVQKRPPQSSQKLWGGRLFAVASFALRLVPCASALGFIAGLRRPLPPRCWVQKRPPQSSQKLWGGRLFAVASFALRLVPCASALGFIAGLRRPLPPRCWVQKRPPQSSQKLWGGRLFAVASFAFRPCALRVSAGLRRSASPLRRFAASPLRRCAFRLVPCALALGFAAVLRRFAAVPLRPPPCALRVSAGLYRRASPPLPPRCWVQKRPPQSSQKLWGGRLFAVASFAFRLVPCASALGFAAVLSLGFAAVLSLGFAAVLSPGSAAVLRRFALRPCAQRVSAGLRRSASPLRRCAASPSALCPARQRWASPPGSAASVFGSRCRYASSLENSSKEISFLSSVTTSFSAVISLRSAAWLTNWSACSGFFSISSA